MQPEPEIFPGKLYRAQKRNAECGVYNIFKATSGQEEQITSAVITLISHLLSMVLHTLNVSVSLETEAWKSLNSDLPKMLGRTKSLIHSQLKS